MALQSAALIQMGAYYDLPRTAAGCTSDAHQPGPEAVLEKIITTIPPVLAGADIVVGFGEIEGDQNLVLEQIIVDNEIARQCQRLAGGVDSQDTKDLISDILHVGPGGHFLAAKNTRLAPRSGEFYISDLLPRHTHDAWLELGKPSMYDKARLTVHEILAGPVIDPLPENVTEVLAEILRRADEDLGSRS
jgi:trimethylamine--corrinoid protein Co-methyltransferase